MTAPIDPRRAFVFEVGIETYGDDFLPGLPGAADAAVRFAAWAGSCGVLRERILLACTWLDEPPAELPGERIGTDRHIIANAIERQIGTAGARGDALFIYKITRRRAAQSYFSEPKSSGISSFDEASCTVRFEPQMQSVQAGPRRSARLSQSIRVLRQRSA